MGPRSKVICSARYIAVHGSAGFRPMTPEADVAVKRILAAKNDAGKSGKSGNVDSVSSTSVDTISYDGAPKPQPPAADAAYVSGRDCGDDTKHILGDALSDAKLSGLSVGAQNSMPRSAPSGVAAVRFMVPTRQVVKKRRAPLFASARPARAVASVDAERKSIQATKARSRSRRRARSTGRRSSGTRSGVDRSASPVRAAN
jgi:hypothetical protein